MPRAHPSWPTGTAGRGEPFLHAALPGEGVTCRGDPDSVAKGYRRAIYGPLKGFGRGTQLVSGALKT